MTADRDVPTLLAAIAAGEADSDALLPIVYDELRRMAQSLIADEALGGAGMTLQATALVHEAYLRLSGSGDATWEGRAHFFGAAARAMRRILVERARHRKAIKHGGGMRRAPLDSQTPADSTGGVGEELDAEALYSCVDALERVDARKAEIVMLRYYAGLTIEQTAAALRLSPATIKSEWSYARLWLFREMKRRSLPVGGGLPL